MFYKHIPFISHQKKKSRCGIAYTHIKWKMRYMYLPHVGERKIFCTFQYHILARAAINKSLLFYDGARKFKNYEKEKRFHPKTFIR